MFQANQSVLAKDGVKIQTFLQLVETANKKNTEAKVDN